MSGSLAVLTSTVFCCSSDRDNSCPGAGDRVIFLHKRLQYRRRDARGQAMG